MFEAPRAVIVRSTLGPPTRRAKTRRNRRGGQPRLASPRLCPRASLNPRTQTSWRAHPARREAADQAGRPHDPTELTQRRHRVGRCCSTWCACAAAGEQEVRGAVFGGALRVAEQDGGMVPVPVELASIFVRHAVFGATAAARGAAPKIPIKRRVEGARAPGPGLDARVGELPMASFCGNN